MTLTGLAILFNDVTAGLYVLGMTSIIISFNAFLWAMPPEARPAGVRQILGWSVFGAGFFFFCGNHHRLMSGHYRSGHIVPELGDVVNDGLMMATTFVAWAWLAWKVAQFILEARRLSP